MPEVWLYADSQQMTTLQASGQELEIKGGKIGDQNIWGRDLQRSLRIGVVCEDLCVVTPSGVLTEKKDLRNRVDRVMWCGSHSFPHPPWCLLSSCRKRPRWQEQEIMQNLGNMDFPSLRFIWLEILLIAQPTNFEAI